MIIENECSLHSHKNMVVKMPENRSCRTSENPNVLIPFLIVVVKMEKIYYYTVLIQMRTTLCTILID